MYLSPVRKNIAWLLANNFFKSGISLAVSVFVARYLGPAEFGHLNYAITFSSIFSGLASFGIDSILLRDLSKRDTDKEALLSTSLAIKIIGSFLSILLTFFSCLILGKNTSSTQMILICSTAAIFQSLNVFETYFLSELKSKYSVYIQNSAALIAMSLRLGLIVAGSSTMYFALVYSFEYALIGTGACFIFFKLAYHSFVFRFNSSVAKRMLFESWPVVLASFSLMTQAYNDQVILELKASASDLGQYITAIKIISFFSFIPMAIMSSFSPLVSAAKEKGNDEFEQRLVQLYRTMMSVFIVCGLGIFILGQDVVRIIYGEEYKFAGYLFSIFAVRLFFTNIGSARSLYIVNENLFRYELFISILGALLSASLNFMLIEKFGVMGAFWSSIATYTTTTFLGDLIYRPARKNFFCMMNGISTFYKMKLT